MESKRVGTTPTKLDQDRMTLAVAIENPPIIDGLPIKTPLIVDFSQPPLIFHRRVLKKIHESSIQNSIWW